MRISKFENFLSYSGLIKYIKFNGNKQGDIVTSELYLQLEDDCDVAVTGYVDENTEGFAMKALNVGTFEVVDEIAEAGNYLLMVGSLQAIKLTFGGTADVVIKGVI